MLDKNMINTLHKLKINKQSDEIFLPFGIGGQIAELKEPINKNQKAYLFENVHNENTRTVNGQPSLSGAIVEVTNDMQYIIATKNTTPFYQIWKWSGTMYNELTTNIVLPAQPVIVHQTKNGHIFFGYSTSTAFKIFKIVSDELVEITVTGGSNGIANVVTSYGNHIFVKAQTNAEVFESYYFDGTNYNKLTKTLNGLASQITSVAEIDDNVFMISCNTSPYLYLVEYTTTTATVIINSYEDTNYFLDVAYKIKYDENSNVGFLSGSIFLPEQFGIQVFKYNKITKKIKIEDEFFMNIAMSSTFVTFVEIDTKNKLLFACGNLTQKNLMILNYSDTNNIKQIDNINKTDVFRQAFVRGEYLIYIDFTSNVNFRELNEFNITKTSSINIGNNNQSYYSKLTSDGIYLFHTLVGGTMKMYKNIAGTYNELFDFTEQFLSRIDRLDISFDNKYLLLSQSQFPFFKVFEIDYKTDKLIDLQNIDTYIFGQDAINGNAVCFMPNGREFIVGTKPNAIQNNIYKYRINADKSIERITQTGNGQTVYDVKVSQDNKFVGVGHIDDGFYYPATIYKNDLTLTFLTKIQSTIANLTSGLSINFSKCNNWFTVTGVAGSTKTIIYNIVDEQFVEYRLLDNVLSVDFSVHGKMIATHAISVAKMYDVNSDFAETTIQPTNLPSTASFCLPAFTKYGDMFVLPSINIPNINVYNVDNVIRTTAMASLETKGTYTKNDLGYNSVAGIGYAIQNGTTNDKIIVNRIV